MTPATCLERLINHNIMEGYLQLDSSWVTGTAPASLATSYSLLGHVFCHWLWLSPSSTAVSAVKTWCNAREGGKLLNLGFPGNWKTWMLTEIFGWMVFCSLSIITVEIDSPQMGELLHQYTEWSETIGKYERLLRLYSMTRMYSVHLILIYT